MQIKKVLIVSAAVMGSSLMASAQNETTRAESRSEWYVGIGGGINASQMSISKIDKDYFPDKQGNLSGVFSVFAEWDFGKERSFAIRPQFSFLTRGGSINNIGKNVLEGYLIPEGAAPDYVYLKNLNYKVKATYWDIRLPLIYQFCKAQSRFRPYVYVAPVFGVTTSGFVSTAAHYSDNSFAGYKFDASNANMSSIYFAGAVGLGLKYQFNISRSLFFLGLDLNYQVGISNTYGSGERDGKLKSIVNLAPESEFTKNSVNGSRRFSGFEIQATLGIPLSVFKKKRPEPVVVEPVVEPVVVTEPVKVQPVEVVDKPCYSLDEIIDLMQKGQSVEGKTICAIDDINFEFGKSSISPQSYGYLRKLAETFKRMNVNICVNGHTDNVGSEEANMELSKQRAMAVVDFLINNGVNPQKLSYAYYGMEKPLTSNDTAEGRKLNRRVEFELR